MTLDILEPVFRLILLAEFAFMAVAGIAAAIHCLTLDSEIRSISSIQRQMLEGIREGLEAKKAERESKIAARLAAMREGI
ncbi:MAG: hypothetical protein HY751_00170 [Nitrospinae bacterium]|nr:hypothetical protein [Nitrospinota bacterium]